MSVKNGILTGGGLAGMRRGLGNGVPGAIQTAAALERTSNDAHKEHWPYPWEYPPAEAEAFNLETRTPTPAANSASFDTEAWSYTVPDGEFLRVKGIMLYVVGAQLADVLGKVFWQWTLNIPGSIGAGVTAPIEASGVIVPQWGDTTGGIISIPKGSPDSGPWPIPGRLVIEPRYTVRVLLRTTGGFPTSGVIFLTSLVGWTWPGR